MCNSKAPSQPPCELGFAEWMGVGVPVGLAMLLASYISIIVAYRPSVARVPVFDSGPRVFFSWQHNVTCFTLAATAALWCTFTFVSPYFGSLGAIGLIPVIVRRPASLPISILPCSAQVLHGSGILDVADLKSLDWHVLLLLGGGGALGRAIRDSGLLHEVGDSIIRLMGSDASPFALLSVFVIAILILTNFVSHTVASITMMPVVVEVVRCSLGKAVGQSPSLCLPSSAPHLHRRSLCAALRAGHQRRLRPPRLLLSQHIHLQRAARRWPARAPVSRFHQDRQRCRRRVLRRLRSRRVSLVLFPDKVLLSK